MHELEPHYKWRDYYESEKDKRSPFYGRVYDEFYYTQKVYNYFIHPQWDDFGSQTLYTKVLYINYDQEVAILEFIGEWNDALHNDVMFLKREVIDVMIKEGITKFLIIAENVLNFHGSDDSYYEEWWEDIRDEGGWVCFMNLLPHVEEEMAEMELQHYVNFGGVLNEFNWRTHKPKSLMNIIETLIAGEQKKLHY